jgi:Uma2 family endonuclease
MNTLMAGAPRKHLITVGEYYRMAEVGLLAPDARVELIEGEIIDMVPIGTRHGRAVDHLARLITLAVMDRAIVRSQGPVRLDNRSEPEPDIALLAPRADRNVKLPLYARHGIPETWIVDLQHNELQMCR